MVNDDLIAKLKMLEYGTHSRRLIDHEALYPEGYVHGLITEVIAALTGQGETPNTPEHIRRDISGGLRRWAAKNTAAQVDAAPHDTRRDFDPLDAQDIVEKMPRLTRLVLRVFGRRLNRGLFSPVLDRAYERGVINSRQLHAICKHFDPTQRGVVGIVRGVAAEHGASEGSQRGAFIINEQPLCRCPPGTCILHPSLTTCGMRERTPPAASLLPAEGLDVETLARKTAHALFPVVMTGSGYINEESPRNLEEKGWKSAQVEWAYPIILAALRAVAEARR